MTYQIKTTWTEHGTNNAACIGNDETVTIEAESPQAACKEVAEAAINFHETDWNTGKYDVMAEHVNGSEVHGIEFCEA